MQRNQLTSATLSLLALLSLSCLVSACHDGGVIGGGRQTFMRDSVHVGADAIIAAGASGTMYRMTAPMSAGDRFADSVLSVATSHGIDILDAWYPDGSYICGACCIPPALCVRLSNPDARMGDLGFAEGPGGTKCYVGWYHYTFSRP